MPSYTLWQGSQISSDYLFCFIINAQIKGENKVAYDALYFVSSYGFSQSSLNPGGRSVTISYIKEKKDTETASKKENARDSFLLAFDVNLGDSFTLTYNDTVLKELGE